MKLLFLVLFFVLTFTAAEDYEFPEEFLFGVSTASYQIEGAWDEDGKEENIWDWLIHTNPDFVSDKSNGDIACDAYHKTTEDVQLLKALNVSLYRFSISWARIFPTGHVNVMNEYGFQYYDELIDELLANGITPLVTMYHWDLPITLHELGGWPNPAMAQLYVDYADKLFELFGEKVKNWITFNEPLQICEFGYSDGVLSPGYTQEGIGGYLCTHTLLRAHGMTYRLYEEKYKPTQEGRLGISVHGVWSEPDSTSQEDITATNNYLQYHFGLYVHPIYIGDYPSEMRTRIDTLSKEQGFPRSRLPTLTEEEITMIKGSSDFLGINHYTTYMCAALKQDAYTVLPALGGDSLIDCYQPDEWEPAASRWLRVAPWGVRKLLNWVKEEYDNPDVIITENGYSDATGELNDCKRIEYYNAYLAEILNAIHEDGCNVIAYTAWSFMDNFEWNSGYTQKFGLYHVDFDDLNRPRTPKMSAYVFKNIIGTRKIDVDYTPEGFERCAAISINLSTINKFLITLIFTYLLLK